MKRNALTILAIIGAAVFIAACANFDKNLYRSQATIVSTVERSRDSWADFYVRATNNPTAMGVDLVKVNRAKVEIDAAYLRYQSAMSAFDFARASYQNKLVGQTNVTEALRAVSDASSYLEQLVLQITQTKGKP